MARDPNDIFNDPFDSWDDSVDTPRRRGRPASKRLTAKGANGRPRIRPLQDKYSRRRGRPALNSTSIADRIEKESLVGGTYFDKSIISSMKSLSGSIESFQSKVVAPLAKSVDRFASSVKQFNAYHQQYLKDQVAISREIHETFKLFRKTSIDPLLRNLARTQRGTSSLYQTFNAVSQSGYTKQEFRDFKNSLGKIDHHLEQTLKTGVVATEATDTFLKEYYKTSKGTSKFLNSVAFATEDIAEDINTLKDNLARYFKGKHNVSILQDQTETLRKIEKNTAAPTVGKRILSSVMGGIVAAAKTAFKYNREGTSQFLNSAFGIQMPNLENMRDDTLLGKLGTVVRDAYDIAIRRKVRDAKGKLQNTFQAIDIGMEDEVPMRVAEGLERVGRSAGSMVQAIRKAWDESKVKEWASYFWAVGETYLYNAWDRYGAMGQRSINATITNYGNKTGEPHPGHHTNDMLEDLLRIMRKTEAGEYTQLGDRPLPPNVTNIFKKKKKQDLDDLFGDLYYGSSALSIPPEVGGYTFGKGKSKLEGWGSGSKVVTFESKSEQDINSANVATPRQAFGSLAKLQGRAVGYLKKIWQSTKTGTTSIREKSSNWLSSALTGAGTAFAGTKLGKALLSLKHGWRGAALTGAAALAGAKGIKLAKAGGTLRTLWDTFGWGSTKSKGSMNALGLFKTTKLGGSWLGTLIRRARIAAAGRGTDLGSRLLGGLIHGNKWGLEGPLGWMMGLAHGTGLKFSKVQGKLLPQISLGGRKAIATLGGGVAAKGGSRLANLAKEAKALEFAEKHPNIAKTLGTGFFGHIAGAGTTLGQGIAKAMTKIPSKDRVLGGILKVVGGGAALKMLGKVGGKGVAKALAKQIPILGAIVGIGFGIHRFTKGDVLGGIMEIISGLLTLVPSGWGNAAALGIDVALVNRDLKRKKLPKQKGEPKLEKEKVTEAFGLGPNPSGAEVVGAGAIAAENARRSETNNISKAQQLDTNPYLERVPLPNRPKKLTLFDKIGNWANNNLAIPAKGEKVYQTKDTGAISWNGKRHDRLLPKFQKALFSAADEMYKNTGHQVNITSAIRTDEEQAALYYRWKNGDKSVMKPALPVNDYPQYKIRGTHNNKRSGHLVGGAVDVSNWREFKPYALKYGLSWNGSGDPVHFQINDKAPVIASAKPQPQITNAPTSNNSGTGDGDTYMARTQPFTSTNSGTVPVQPSSSIQTEVSPMIQDYGLAIINSLIFA